MADFINSALTQADVARLLAEPSPHVRAELAGKIASEIDSPKLTEQELNLAQDIVRAMARDVEVSVRQALAQSLRQADRLPHDVAVRLANDVEKVALPVLMHSQVLTDDDLAAVVQGGAAAKHEAIAARAVVSEKISEALIEKAGEKAVATLMANSGAKITETSLNKAVDRFSGSETVKENMAKRQVLPVTVTERLVAMVSENLKDYLATHHDLPPSLAADIVMQSRERTIINLSGGSSEEELAKLVAQMYKNKRLTPSLIIRALCMGDVAFFETALALMANVPLLNARILIHDGGRIGLEKLYVKAGMPPRLWNAVRIAVDVVHETSFDGGENDRERYKARVIERILTQYQDLGAEDLDYLLTKLGGALHAAA